MQIGQILPFQILILRFSTAYSSSFYLKPNRVFDLRYIKFTLYKIMNKVYETLIVNCASINLTVCSFLVFQNSFGFWYSSDTFQLGLRSSVILLFGVCLLERLWYTWREHGYNFQNFFQKTFSHRQTRLFAFLILRWIFWNVVFLRKNRNHWDKLLRTFFIVNILKRLKS